MKSEIFQSNLGFYGFGHTQLILVIFQIAIRSSKYGNLVLPSIILDKLPKSNILTECKLVNSKQIIL
jgi:hypothetical protein